MFNVLVTVFLNRFMEGLNVHGLVDEIRRNPAAWQPVFIYHHKKLQPETLLDVFIVQWSAQGSNKLGAEKQVFSYWRELLQEIYG